MSSEPRQRLAALKSYPGVLRYGDNQLSLSPRFGIDSSGEVEIELDPVKLSNETKFILLSWYAKGDDYRYFSFSGVAADGGRFETEHLHITSLHQQSDNSGTVMRLEVRCRKATLRFRLSEPVAKPILRLRLKGFENLGSHHATSRLGRVALAGEHSVEDRNAVTGYIVLEAPDQPIDVPAWRSEGDRLLEHIRLIMSFAASSLLRAPIVESFNGNDAEVTLLSQTAQERSGFRTVHFLAQENIFEAAIRSFFDPPIVVQKLFFAIEWFSMAASYNELRLVASMTALEILIDANAVDEETLIQPRRQFDKTRSAFRAVIRQCLAKQEIADGEALLKELNEKLADLNRRALLVKLNLLAKRWNVPLEGLEAGLKAAKNARDRVVHRGQYYDDVKDEDADLWSHISVVREVVVRFLLTAIGYRGRYTSYIGDHHDVDFPPIAAIPHNTQGTE